MDNIQYEKIGEVNGRWKADVIESFLISKNIQVQLIQDATTHYLYRSAYDLVAVYVPSTQKAKALKLLKTFEEFQAEKDE